MHRLVAKATIRGGAFWLIFCLWTAVLGTATLPLLVSHKATSAVANIWAWNFVWLLRGFGVQSRTVGALPKEHQNYLLASQHQSAWETIALFAFLKEPRYVLKRSLFFIPLVGLYLMRLGMIGIDRSKPLHSLRKLTRLESQLKSVRQRRPIVIFPQGTRGGNTIKGGAYLLLGKRTLMVATLNSGAIMPPRSIKLHKGVATIRFKGGFKKALARSAFNRILRAELLPTKTKRTT